jgi:hypothetical protein
MLGTSVQASTADWFVRVQADTPLAIAKGATVPALKLLPQRVFELAADATPVGSKYPVQRGTLLIEVDGKGSGKYCGMARHLGSAFHCLADRDLDGTVESYYYQQVFNEFYFGSTFGEDGKTPLQAPAQLRELDPFAQIEPVNLGLRFHAGSPGKKMEFKLCVEEPSGAAHWRKGLYKTCLDQSFPVDTQTGKLVLLGISAQVTRVDDRRVSITFPGDLRIVPVTLSGTRL